MTGGKRKVRPTCRVSLYVADIDGGGVIIMCKDESSLTCLAADESEPYCLDEGGRCGWESWPGAGAYLSMRGKGRVGAALFTEVVFTCCT